MQIQIYTGWLWWRRLRTFEGECTVWHDVETGERASSYLEMRLSEIEWQRRRKLRMDRDDE
jgi:hypothetical protein